MPNLQEAASELLASLPGPLAHGIVVSVEGDCILVASHERDLGFAITKRNVDDGHYQAVFDAALPRLVELLSTTDESTVRE